MGKVLNVDFKLKKLEFTWDEPDKDKQTEQVVELYKTLIVAYDMVLNIVPRDKVYLDYCNTVFSGIISNLRNR